MAFHSSAAASGRVPAAVHPEVAQLLRRAAHCEALVLARRHAAAERLLREVAGALERRCAVAPAVQVWTTLTAHLLERARAADAERCARHAVRVAGEGEPALMAMACLSLAWAQLEQLRIVAAESTAGQALAAAEGPWVVRARATRAKCLMLQGRWNEVTDAGHEPSDDTRWDAIVHEVEVERLVAQGHLADAGRRTRVALATWGRSAPAIAQTILRIAHLRVVLCTGDAALARQALDEALQAADRARAPLRRARAIGLWCAALRDTGQAVASSREGRLLTRLARVASPLVARDVDQRMPQTRAGVCLPALVSGQEVRPRSGPVIAAVLDRVWSLRDDQALSAALVCAREGFCLVGLGIAAQTPRGTLMLGVVGEPVSPTLVEAVARTGGISRDGADGVGVPVRVAGTVVAALVARTSGSIDGEALADGLQAVAAALAPSVESRLAGHEADSASAVEWPELLGVSEATRELRRAVLRAAKAPFAVLIEGESGVGKELVARAIHAHSDRRDRRFCDVNCAALPDELLESELFGHARGAFTGAVADRAGLFEEASGGTLFLDEVAELSARAQAKLLRAIQQQQVRRIGESVPRDVDVRLVAAANRRLDGEVAAGRFRADLRYRLDVIHIGIRPLRERPDDIREIARHLWPRAAARMRSTATLSPAAIEALCRYNWPGNVRELQNVLAATAVAAPSRGRVGADLLPLPIRAFGAGVDEPSMARARAHFERTMIERVLARVGGNRTRAAEVLGLTRQGLLKSMRRLGLSGRVVE